jgi:hypothetical protein
MCAQAMTDRQEAPSRRATARRLVCSGCGTEFGCGLSASCWCAEETARLPLPAGSEDCLCRDCLRKAAAQAPRSPDEAQA